MDLADRTLPFHTPTRWPGKTSPFLLSFLTRDGKRPRWSKASVSNSRLYVPSEDEGQVLVRFFDNCVLGVLDPSAQLVAENLRRLLNQSVRGHWEIQQAEMVPARLVHRKVIQEKDVIGTSFMIAFETKRDRDLFATARATARPTDGLIIEGRRR